MFDLIHSEKRGVDDHLSWQDATDVDSCFRDCVWREARKWLPFVVCPLVVVVIWLDFLMLSWKTIQCNYNAQFLLSSSTSLFSQFITSLLFPHLPLLMFSAAPHYILLSLNLTRWWFSIIAYFHWKKLMNALYLF